MDFIKELTEFLITRKKYWLIPIIVFLAFFGLIIVLGSGSAITPFIYATF